MPANESIRFFKRAPGRASGFSLIELLVVLGVLAVLALLASPALTSLVPRYHLRSAARSAEALMQQARMTAVNAGRPARMVVDCRDRGGNADKPCTMSIYMAVFKDNGDLDKWVTLPGTSRTLPLTVSIAPLAGANKTAGSADHLYWNVFMPAGYVKASHDPIGVKLSSTSTSIGAWNLAVSRSSGRSTLTR
ncbi:prepilin-type N-terminal cleavage/methylation domain-containing protein [Deltaproteobacteria bacterium OttesenSCG-928-K17]|nr:prepilin-type N-terminal cleavage/methylation domain-containing protein [Deltaproteobacteria bacterium OttesenSCG-928-K17]